MCFRSAVTALAALAFSVSLHADPLCSRGTWGSRGISTDFNLQGTTLFAAEGRGVAMYDVGSAAAVRRLASAPTASPARLVAVSGDTLFTATADELSAFRIAPDSLTFISSAPLAAGSVLTANPSHIITAAGSLVVWGFNGPQLTPTATAPLTGPAVAALLDGDVLYVAEQDVGIEVFDLASGSPVRIGGIAVNAAGLAKSGPYLYGASRDQGITVMDVADPRAARVLGNVQAGDVDYRELALSGDRLYAIDHVRGSRVGIFSLADPAQPRLMATFEEPAAAIAAAGTLLYVSGTVNDAATGAPVRVFDTAVATAPQLAGELRDYAGPLTGAATDGSFAYVADPPLFRVIDIRAPAAPQEIARLAIDDPFDRVRLRGTVALVYGVASVHLIDVSVPTAPREIGVYRSLGLPPNGADMAGPYLIEANRATGFHVLDITDLSSPRQVGGLKNDGYGQFFDVLARPGVAYSRVNRGIKVIDLAQPNHPVLARVVVLGDVVDVAMAPATNGHPELLVAIDSGTLRFFSLESPLNPLEVGTLAIPASTHVAVDANTAYVATVDGTIQQIDFTDPSRPQLTGSMAGFMAPAQISSSGSRVVVADTYSLRILSAGERPADSPVVSLSGKPAPGAARITWSSAWAGPFEVQTASDASFTSPTTISTDAPEATIAAAGTTWVRVRGAGACDPGPWSSALRIDAPQSGIVFEERGQHVLVGNGQPAFTVDVPMKNLSTAPLTATITSSAAGVQVPASITIAGGSGSLLSVRIDPSAMGAATTANIAATTTGGSDEMQLEISKLTPTASTGAAAGAYQLIPGVASAPGSAGTTWKSDLALFCESDAPCTTLLRFVPFGGRSDATGVTLTFRPQETVVAEDVVGRIFGKTAAGSIEIEGADSIRASASTYNDSPAGRFGQRITPVRLGAAAATVNGPRRLLGVTQNAAARTNVGIVNATGQPVVITLTLLDPAGAVAGTTNVGILPDGSLQPSLTQLFGAVNLDAGSIRVDAPAGVIVYDSRIDQRTGDGVFSYADAIASGNGSEELVFPSAASLPGALSSHWSTAFQIAAGNVPASVEIAFIPAGDPNLAKTTSLQLPAGGSFYAADLVNALFPELSRLGAVLGWMRLRSTAPIAGWEYIYNETAAGNYGQYIPPAPLTREISAGSLINPVGQIFPVEESSARRTNLGLTEVSGKAALVRLSAFDGSGALLGFEDRYLSPYTTQLLTSWLAGRGLEDVRSGRIEVRQIAGEGHVESYASVVENSTGDAAFIPAE